MKNSVNFKIELHSFWICVDRWRRWNHFLLFWIYCVLFRTKHLSMEKIHQIGFMVFWLVQIIPKFEWIAQTVSRVKIKIPSVTASGRSIFLRSKCFVKNKRSFWSKNDDWNSRAADPLWNECQAPRTTKGVDFSKMRSSEIWFIFRTVFLWRNNERDLFSKK